MSNKDLLVQREIMLGENVCVKIKNIYFKELPWANCYKDVAHKFSMLKSVACKFYPEKNKIDILLEICKYNEQDIIDAL